MRPFARTDQRGAVLPSPVVILSVVAVALAALTFVLTRHDGAKERDITTVASSHASGSPKANASASAGSSARPSKAPSAKPKKKHKAIQRSQVGVVVFNDTSITGLAGSVGQKVSHLGWHFVAADNWVGTVPATTVYFPKGMRPAARQLALDLGVQRIMPADPASNMSSSSLTLILTGPLS
ncbi:MAG: LytR C-terminal domain-containing protein [Nocardioidaceae bacterium]|nr:LytR C-terminal domain-containing protein [Nocardioidaceae bacterium]MCL2612802.1 LytR C-terminal domain-containing protein [Nocardioidaceae bacterium]